MAGRELSGFANSVEKLFINRSYIFTKTDKTNQNALNELTEMAYDLGCSDITITTPKKHDAMIAFTSQLPHVLAGAYVKSPASDEHKGFSAGSYKDLTRVAWLNPQMWAELFLENKENVLYELSFYIDSLKAYQKAIEDNDLKTLVDLLEEGKLRKEQVDG